MRLFHSASISISLSGIRVSMCRQDRIKQITSLESREIKLDSRKFLAQGALCLWQVEIPSLHWRTFPSSSENSPCITQLRTKMIDKLRFFCSMTVLLSRIFWVSGCGTFHSYRPVIPCGLRVGLEQVYILPYPRDFQMQQVFNTCRTVNHFGI